MLLLQDLFDLRRLWQRSSVVVGCLSEDETRCDTSSSRNAIDDVLVPVKEGEGSGDELAAVLQEVAEILLVNIGDVGSEPLRHQCPKLELLSMCDCGCDGCVVGEFLKDGELHEWFSGFGECHGCGVASSCQQQCQDVSLVFLQEIPEMVEDSHFTPNNKLLRTRRGVSCSCDDHYGQNSMGFRRFSINIRLVSG